MTFDVILYIAGSFCVGGILAFVLQKSASETEKVKQKAEEMVQKAQEESTRLKRETDDKVLKSKEAFKQSEEDLNEFLKKLEESLEGKEENVKKKEGKIQEIQKVLDEEERESALKKEENKELEMRLVDGIMKKAQQKKEDIREKMIKDLERELREENEIRLAHLEEFYKENAEQEAKNVVLNSLQRLSSPTSNEKRGTQVIVPRDPLKLKVIGKNAENIQKLEEILEIDVIFNDFPNVITISHYNLFTRQIAKRTIERLFEERGEVTPDTVVKNIEEAKKDMDKELLKMGKEALKRMNIKRVLQDEMVQTIGRLQFRTSYGQNIMRHSFEVGLLALMMGYELGAEVETCKIGGFLHDLGKAIDQNPDIIGAHDYLTKELMEKYNFPEKEVHAAWTHHDSEPPRTTEAFLIKGADAISAGRPGAREEALDKYIERMKQLNEIANSYEGVSKVQIMSAGREVRVYVNPGELADDLMQPLAENIAKEVKENVAYPGYVRINAIRRTQTTETAK
ncbi:MAG: HD domain-containing protein [Patescibacteria group bacterium]